MAERSPAARGVKLRWWHGIALNMILAALVLSGAAFYTARFGSGAKEPFLEIRDERSGKVYGAWPVPEGGGFAVEFVHSVHQSPVKESFTVRDGEIRPESVRFSSFGAGMLSDLAAGQTMSRDGEALVVSGFTVSFTELNYIVGTVSDHLLYINGKTISLRELCGKNAHITMRYRGAAKKAAARYNTGSRSDKGETL